MAELTMLPFVRHLRAEPNQLILHYRKGQLRRKGAGLAYWFRPLSASIAQLPVEDCETTFVLNERTSDFQDVMVQCTLSYRVTDAERAASRVNFTISLSNGRWIEEPLERLANLWSRQARQPARAYLAGVPLREAIQSGPQKILQAIELSLRADPEIAAMGLSLVTVQINRIAPTPELEKALQTPTREQIQQRADEAVFNRRAQAVEKERAIKQNELATQVELAHQEEGLIRQKSANQMLQLGHETDFERRKTEAGIERQGLEAQAYAGQVETRARGDARAQELLAEAQARFEQARVDLYSKAPNKVVLGLALREMATKIQNIQHLNITPDLLRQSLEQLLRDKT